MRIIMLCCTQQRHFSRPTLLPSLLGFQMSATGTDIGCVFAWYAQPALESGMIHSPILPPDLDPLTYWPVPGFFKGN
jgi:hypothetical protein